MTGLFPVMIGGALGAGARYIVGFVVGSPWATLTVNLIGGLAMGLLMGSLARSSEGWRLFAGVGVLGGFTTFSAFGMDSWRMIERGQFALAVFYVTASVVGAVLLTGLGLWITRA
jgi:fluoride exporter